MTQADIETHLAIFYTETVGKQNARWNGTGFAGECQSLVLNWVHYCFALPAFSGNAKDMVNVLPRLGFKEVPLKDARAGSVLVSTAGTWGHIGIGMGKWGEGKGIYEQNWGVPKKREAHINKRNLDGYRCFVWGKIEEASNATGGESGKNNDSNNNANAGSGVINDDDAVKIGDYVRTNATIDTYTKGAINLRVINDDHSVYVKDTFCGAQLLKDGKGAPRCHVPKSSLYKV